MFETAAGMLASGLYVYGVTYEGHVVFFPAIMQQLNTWPVARVQLEKQNVCVIDRLFSTLCEYLYS